MNELVSLFQAAVVVVVVVVVLTLASYVVMPPENDVKHFCAVCGNDASFTIGEKFLCMRCWKRALRERAS